MEIFKLFGTVLVDSDKAEKSIHQTDSKAQKMAKTLGGGIKTAAKWGAGLATAAAGAATAVVAGLLKMDEATKEYRENMALLNTAWQAAGSDAETAKEAYEGLYSVIGDQGAATEAAQLLANVATSTEDVAKWTDIAAGVAGTFGEALPVNSLIEAANETQKVGVVTGAMADALNWAGISEDAFNEKLAACGSEQERNKLITETLSSTYEEATGAFKENNAEVLKARDAQAKLDEAMGKLGGAVSNIKTSMMGEFVPAFADAASAFGDLLMGVEGADERLQVAIGKMIDKFIQSLPKFLEFGMKVIVTVAKGIAENLPSLLRQLPALVDTIVRELLSLASQLWDVGREMITELWDGLKAKWSSVSSWFESKTRWIKDKLFFWRRSQREMDEGNVNGNHASGLPYVPYDNYKANLHRGERVLTAAEAERYDRGAQSFVGGTINITVNGAKYQDEQQLAEVIAEKIQDLTDRKRAAYA